MERPKINTAFDAHDYDQLVMLAKLNRMKLSQLVRHIVRTYLDKGTLNLKEALPTKGQDNA